MKQVAQQVTTTPHVQGKKRYRKYVVSDVCAATSLEERYLLVDRSSLSGVLTKQAIAFVASWEKTEGFSCGAGRRVNGIIYITTNLMENNEPRTRTGCTYFKGRMFQLIFSNNKNSMREQTRK